MVSGTFLNSQLYLVPASSFSTRGEKSSSYSRYPGLYDFMLKLYPWGMIKLILWLR